MQTVRSVSWNLDFVGGRHATEERGEELVPRPENVRGAQHRDIERRTEERGFACHLGQEVGIGAVRILSVVSHAQAAEKDETKHTGGVAGSHDIGESRGLGPIHGVGTGGDRGGVRDSVTSAQKRDQGGKGRSAQVGDTNGRPAKALNNVGARLRAHHAYHLDARRGRGFHQVSPHKPVGPDDGDLPQHSESGRVSLRSAGLAGHYPGSYQPCC